VFKKIRKLYSVTAGLMVNIGIGYTISYILYPLLILRLGYVTGLIVVWALSFIVSYSMFLLYAWTKKDFIGIDLIRAGIKKKEAHTFFGKLLAWAIKKGDKVYFIVLSIKFGAFTSIVYMRDPHDYSKMRKKDWKIFWIGYLLTNIFSTIVTILGILIFKSIK
jgi:hypothetical protein